MIKAMLGRGLGLLARLSAQGRRIWQVLMAASPRWTAGALIATLIETFLSIASLYVIKLLVDAIGEGLKAPDARAGILLMLVLTGATFLAATAAQSLAGYVRGQQGFEVAEFIDRQIHQRAIEVDLAFFESPLYLDSLQKAREAGTQRPAQVVANLLALLRGGIMLFGIFWMLLAIEWRLLPVLAVMVGLALVVRLTSTRRMFAWRMQQAQLERKAGYLDWMLTSNTHAKELRLNQLGQHFSAAYTALRRQIRAGHFTLEKRRLRAELGVALVATLIFVSASGYLITLALAGALSVGQVVLFVMLLRRAEASGNEVVSALSRLMDDFLYLDRLFLFLDTRSGLGETTRGHSPHALPASPHEVRFESVSFSYPGAARPAVAGLDLVLRTGQITALVGENGSGKTTLIKLLTRLYDPTAGRITLDGVDIRAFDPEAYRRLFSVIFQDYAMYPETVSENIRFGDVTLPDAARRVPAAAHQGGAEGFIARLSKGFETPLTSLFDDGHDLSLGQWQRLALSRAFYPASQFMILDEPTSAVDPAAEFALFENFRARLGGRGALIISHRLSTVRQSDHCYVLADGRITEAGTHDSLVRQGGVYAKLFEQQAVHYR
jgi:ATP-binding cassette, subfamily B, bacterial